MDSGVGPLLALSALTLLVLLDCVAPADQLRRLSSLPALGALHLHFDGGKARRSDLLPRACAALSALPLAALTAVYQHVSADTLRRLGSCTRLTSLLLEGCELDISMDQLAVALAKLPTLQELVLIDTSAIGGSGGGDEAAASAARRGEGAGAPAQAWPQLRRLWLANTRWEHVQVFSSLLALAQVTALQLETLEKGDDDVVPLICACSTGLRELVLADEGDVPCTDVTDAALAAVAAGLPRLTHLTLEGLPGISDAGVKWLSALRHLRELCVYSCSHVSAPAQRAAMGIAW